MEKGNPKEATSLFFRAEQIVSGLFSLQGSTRLCPRFVSAVSD